MGFDRFRDLVGELYTVSCQCGNTGVSVVEIRLLMRNRSYTEVLIPSNISPLPFIARVFNTVWAHTRPGEVNDPQERSRGQSALCMTEERQSIHLIQREILSEIKKKKFHCCWDCCSTLRFFSPKTELQPVRSCKRNKRPLSSERPSAG